LEGRVVLLSYTKLPNKSSATIIYSSAIPAPFVDYFFKYLPTRAEKHYTTCVSKRNLLFRVVLRLLVGDTTAAC